MTVSLILTIYKSTDFLERVLESIMRQSHKPDQIIITEDGEFPPNKEVIEKYKRRTPISILHLTQKDIGNRKPLALNKAILKATSEYLVFVDGDCVLREDFIKTHLEMAGEDRFLTGRRVELSEKASKILTREKIASGYLRQIPWALVWDAVTGETQYWGRFFKTPKLLRGIFGQNKIDDIRGCNFSVHRKHMIAINGFSNDFSGAYGEDSDVEYRLKFLGLKMASVKGAAIQYHLWHKTQVKDSENQIRLEQVLKSGKPATPNGLAEAAQIS